MAIKLGDKITKTPGWTVKSIKDIAPLQRGFDLPISKIEDGPFPVVYSNGIARTHKCSMVKAPGVVTGRSGTIGNIHYIDQDYWPHNTSLWVTSFKGNNPKFIYYLFQAIGFERFASGSGVPTLNRNDAHGFAVSIPNAESEQSAIASALSDADALINGLDQLLAKKRDLKQAAMQQLLTGQRRLPGFCGTWVTATIGDKTVKVGSGITPTGGAQVYRVSGRAFIRSQNVGWGRLLLDDIAFIDNQTHESFNSTEIKIGDVFLNITGASIGRSAVSDDRVHGGNVNQHVCIIRPKPEELNSEYLNYFLLSGAGQTQIDSFQAGGNRQGLNFSQVRSICLPCPPPAEQLAIATVLSDMDAEVVALEARRDKAVALKQGMMQELLTGRIRLV